MTESLEQLLASFIQCGVAVAEAPLRSEIIKGLGVLAQDLYRNGEYHPARVGKGVGKMRKPQIRGDFVHWVDRWEDSPLSELHEFLAGLQLELRRLYLPVKRWESHFACYPPGSHYQPHRDRHRKNPNRLVTAVLYLADRAQGDGGELVIHLSNGSTKTVEPHKGSFVVFDSELVHEVLPTRKKRWSLTTWFRDDIDGAVNLI